MTTPSAHTHTDAATVAQTLADSAEFIAPALLGKPTAKSRREYRWGSKGSVSLCLVGPKRGIWCDFERLEGGDMLDLVARQHDVPLGDAIKIAQRDYLGEAIAPTPNRPELSPSASADDAEARTRSALRIWRETVPLTGTMGERYFVDRRGLDIRLLDIDHALRWHFVTGAVVALMTDAVSGGAIGIHRTFLDACGAKVERKMLGRQGVVRLSPNSEVTKGLGICEGLEDGLAVMLSGWTPIWAATSAGAIARFPVLDGIDALTIFADADASGMQAAKACAARWRAVGREVRASYPRKAAPDVQ